MNKKNIIWINNIKALAIIAVYLIHVQTIYGYSIGLLKGLISPWYVNAFFFVSGYLIYRKQLTQPLIDQNRFEYIMGGGKISILNIFYRIIIPSVFFACIEYIPSCLIQGRELSLTNFLFKTVGGGTYWFTSALVIAEIITILLLVSRKKELIFYFLISLLIGSVGIVMQHGLFANEIWAYHRGIIAVMFLAFGGLYWKYESIINVSLKWYSLIFLAVIYIFIVFLSPENFSLISILTLQPLGVISAIIAIVLLIKGCKYLPENNVMSFLGQNTLMFYFLSGALPIILSVLAHKLICGTYFVVMLIVLFLSLLFAFFITFILNKFAPWCFDLRKIAKPLSNV